MLQKMAVVDVPRKNGWQPTSTQETNPTWADADDDEKDADDLLGKKCHALVAVPPLLLADSFATRALQDPKAWPKAWSSVWLWAKPW